MRDYDAAAGRWTAKDPIGFNSGLGDLYVYSACDPVRFTDTSGRSLSLSDLWHWLVRFLCNDSSDPFSLSGIAWNTLNGWRAFLDGVTLGTPYRDAGYYSDDDPGVTISREVGRWTRNFELIAGTAGMIVTSQAFRDNALVGENGPIFGFRAKPINGNNFVRVGFSYQKVGIGAEKVFRAVVGRKNDPLPGWRHLDF